MLFGRFNLCFVNRQF